MSNIEPKLGLRTCIYKVSDLDTAVEWYSKAFDTKPTFQAPSYVGFSVGGFELGLMPDPTPPEGKVDNMLTYWGVENLKPAVDELVAMGATIVGPITNVGDDIELAELADPWGNMLGLIYNPNFKA